MSENKENNLILKTSLLLEKNYAGLKITKASLKKINGNELITFECIMDGIKKTINGLYDQFGNTIISILDLKRIIIKDNNIIMIDELNQEYFITYYRLTDNELEQIYWGHTLKKDFNEEILNTKNLIIMNDQYKKYLYNIQKGEIITPFYDNIELNIEKSNYIVTYTISSNIKLQSEDFNPNITVYLSNLCDFNGKVLYRHFYDIENNKVYRLKNQKDYDRIQQKINYMALNNIKSFNHSKKIKKLKRKNNLLL